MNQHGKTFADIGYELSTIGNLSALNEVREEIAVALKTIFNLDCEDLATEEFLNKFHTFHDVARLTDGEFNENRRRLIEEINSSNHSLSRIFDMCEEQIVKWLGPDVVIQKSINLTIQRPNDPYPTEIHRDSPPNSPYEVTIWIPLTDCLKTKALFLTPLDKSMEIASKLQSYDSCASFEAEVTRCSNCIPALFGQSLFFSPTLFHYSVKNQEDETRFSLNLRVKNMYTPYGLKHPAAFFTPIKHSIISRIGYRASQIDRA
jgi:sporadic carbohydrate cluster 2OG-Fe(II) oxygenase